MKFRALAILLFVTVVATLCGCAGETAPVQEPVAQNIETEVPETVEDPAPKAPIQVELDQVRQEIVNRLSISDPLMLESDMLLDLYGISSELLSQSASFVTMAGTFPDEIILTQAVDEAAADEVATALQRRLDEVLVQSRTYDAENYEAAQSCQVLRNGLYVTLILSPKQAEMTAIVEEYLNG